MSAYLGRALTRRVQALRLYARNASTTAEATKAASQTAEKVGSATGTAASKASEGLSKVTSSAGPAISNAAQSASNALNRVGGRTGRLIGFVQSLVPPTVYYSKVGLELARLIAKDRKMSVPDLATFQGYLQPVINNIRTPSALLNATSSTATSLNPTTLLNRIRNLSNQQLIAAGVVGAEVIGFFTVGQMIGRLKIVGYRTTGHAHGEH